MCVGDCTGAWDTLRASAMVSSSAALLQDSYCQLSKAWPTRSTVDGVECGISVAEVGYQLQRWDFSCRGGMGAATEGEVRAKRAQVQMQKATGAYQRGRERNVRDDDEGKLGPDAPVSRRSIAAPFGQTRRPATL